MAQRVVEDSAELHDHRLEPKLLRALEMVAPGTSLREGIDAVSQARTGALIIIGDPEELAFMFSGGIKLDLEYSPSMLYQLAKMDGAIVITPNTANIAWANVQLLPDPTIASNETGTRHRTAERVAKQSDAIAICVSQRRDVVSLYVDAAKYVMVGIPEVLAKANQALGTLDKFRRRFDQISARLTVQEFTGRATMHDVLILFQRAEMISRMAVEIERFIVELGSEGRLIEMQLEETMIGVAGEKQGLVRDYIAEDSDEQYAQVIEQLARMSHQDLLDFGRLAELFGYDRKTNTIDFGVAPRGYRILGRIPRLPKLVIQNIANEFGGLEALLDATDSELEAVEGVGEVRAKEIREGLKRLQEINMVDRYMQI
jgi:diadenylate cyclase